MLTETEIRELITPATLKKIMPNANLKRIEELYPYLIEAMLESEIISKPRIAAFVSQLAHESGSFKYNEEIASGAAYEGRRDLGNTQKGDGVRFKGRGLIQCTGRITYMQASKALGVDFISNPELASKDEYSPRIAAWYWKSRYLNKQADLCTQESFDKITRLINGALNGKKDRDKYYTKAKEVLGIE